MAFNKVILMGNLTRDPETRTTPSGQSVTNFSIAVNRNWTDKDGQKQEETSFIECDAWATRGETIAKYFSRGRQILISGRLRQDSWEDKDTGKKRSTLRVVVEEFSFVNDGSRGNTATTPSSKDNEVKVEDVDGGEVDLSDIPF